MMKTKHEIQYELYFSANLERLNSAFFRHLDHSIYISQFVLSVFIVAEYGSGFCTGFLLTLLTAFSFTVKPNEKALLSQQQHQRYAELCLNPPSDDAQLLKAFALIQQTDNPCLELLHQAAHIRAGLILGSDMSSEKLSFAEWLISCFAGCFLKRSHN